MFGSHICNVIHKNNAHTRHQGRCYILDATPNVKKGFVDICTFARTLVGKKRRRWSKLAIIEIHHIDFWKHTRSKRHFFIL